MYTSILQFGVMFLTKVLFFWYEDYIKLIRCLDCLKSYKLLMW